MNFQSLNLHNWGSDGIKGELCVAGDNGRITLKLDSAAGARILQVVAKELVLNTVSLAQGLAEEASALLSIDAPVTE